MMPFAARCGEPVGCNLSTPRRHSRGNSLQPAVVFIGLIPSIELNRNPRKHP
jgi:hypothetical protein